MAAYDVYDVVTTGMDISDLVKEYNAQADAIEQLSKQFEKCKKEAAKDVNKGNVSVKGRNNQFSPKIQKQMKKRGWTEKEIDEALQTKGILAEGKKGPATRYVHPTTGKSIVVDNSTGEIFHVGGEGFKY